jgi:hypothetical protein
MTGGLAPKASRKFLVRKTGFSKRKSSISSIYLELVISSLLAKDVKTDSISLHLV